MAKDRTQPCKHYECAGHPCKKGREAEHSGYCQRCDKYEARARIKHVNQKKLKLQKIKEKEIE